MYLEKWEKGSVKMPVTEYGLFSDSFDDGGRNVVLVVRLERFEKFQIAEKLLRSAPIVFDHFSRPRRIGLSLRLHSFHNAHRLHDQFHGRRRILEKSEIVHFSPREEKIAACLHRFD